VPISKKVKVAKMALPTLYAKSKTGKDQVWNIEVIGNVIRTSYGYKDGAITVNEKTVDKGKNIGKKNETTPEQQATAEARSLWDKKKTTGYAESMEASVVPQMGKQEMEHHGKILPMLAHEHGKRGKDIVFPCFVQAKLDGVRCIYNNGVLTSRMGKEFTALDHITGALAGCKLVLDGELYSDTLTFQQFVGLVRKTKHNEAEKKLLVQVKYWIYDCVNSQPFEGRLETLRQFFSTRHDDIVKLLPTEEAKTKEDLKRFHDKYVAEGAEGLIIRNKAGLYQLAARSADLQKYKEFKDDEFEVTGFTEGEGLDKGLVIWICKTKEGRTFNVRPRGTHAERAEFFKNGQTYVGKMLTVRFQELTGDGIPRFPVGIAFRDYE
jgi:DNA ligase-1